MRTTALAMMGSIATLLSLGCSSDPATTPQEPVTRPSLAVVNLPGDGQVGPEEFEICKYGSSATFDYTVVDHNNSNAVTNGQVTLADGECKIIVQSGGFGSDVSVTEQVPTGFLLDHVVVTSLANGVITTSTVSGPTVTGTASGAKSTPPLTGTLAQFYNVAEPPPPPPPPPPGGEGCTPGYWKQSQHFDSWPAPYTPSTQFSAVFEDAFPGKTLLQVLGQGGGGLIALGRHTVAALLNAASSGVSYNLTVQQVIDGFNNVFPGGDYEGQKDLFAGYNEQGCPLN